MYSTPGKHNDVLAELYLQFSFLKGLGYSKVIFLAKFSKIAQEKEGAWVGLFA